MNADLETIEELHQKDQQALLNGEIESLLSLLTNDRILIPADRK